MTMARLAEKIALVTGASRGIGRAIAIALAKEGAAVAVNYRVSEMEARRVVEEISALGVRTMLVPAKREPRCRDTRNGGAGGQGLGANRRDGEQRRNHARQKLAEMTDEGLVRGHQHESQ